MLLTREGRAARDRALAKLSLRVEAMAVGVGLAVMYLLTLAGNQNDSNDGLAYVNHVREGKPAVLFVPAHLLYDWLGWLGYHVGRGLGYGGGPLGPMQMVNAVSAAFGVALLWLLLRTVTSDRLVAIGACGIVAFSYSYWQFGVSVAVYTPSATLLIVTLCAAYRAASRPTWKSFALFGAANGVAVLAHTTNVIFASVAAAALLIAWRKLPPRDVVRCGLAHAGAAAAVVLPVYTLAVVVVGLHGPREIYDWYTTVARVGDWGVWRSSNLPKAVIGMARALIAGQFLWAIGSARDAIQSALPEQNPRAQIFLVRNFNPALAALLVAVAGAVAVGLLALAAGWLRRPVLNDRARILVLLCLGWLASYVPFFVWWNPLDHEFWLALWVPLAILIALPLAGGERTSWGRFRPHIVATVIGGLFLVNLLGSVWPQHRPEDDYWRARATWYEQNVGPADLVFTAGYMWSNYVRYFSGADTVDVYEILYQHGDDWASAVAAIQRRIDASPARRVFFSAEVFYPGANAAACCRDDVPVNEITTLVRKEFLDHSRLVADSGVERVWQLDGR